MALMYITELVSSVHFGAECKCEDVAQIVGTTILFRRIHSGDVVMARMWATRINCHTVIGICKTLKH
jgi:hypothetical protein